MRLEHEIAAAVGRIVAALLLGLAAPGRTTGSARAAGRADHRASVTVPSRTPGAMRPCPSAQ